MLLVSVIHWLSVSTYQAPPALVVLDPPLCKVEILQVAVNKIEVLSSFEVDF